MAACIVLVAACGGEDPPRPKEPPRNAPPDAQAGADREATSGQVVTLSGAGSSDPEGTTLAYVWRQTSGPAVALDNAIAEQTTFTGPRVIANTVLSFSLTVTDSGGATDLDTVAITVLPPPPPPPAPSTYVTDMRLVSTPQSGDTYGATETILMEVVFNEPVRVTGTPALVITIGGQTRQARYIRGSGTRTLTFGYTVREGDHQADGTLGVARLSLAEGTIASTADNQDASEDLGDEEGFEDIKVDGGTNRAATVTEVRIETMPRTGDAYRAGETIGVRVTFSEDVTVTDDGAGGGPSLAFAIGTATHPRKYSEQDDRSLRFDYVVRADDVDVNGIGIAADALQLGGGGIHDVGGVQADLDLGDHAIADAANHKVIAREPARVSGVRIASAPRTGSAYGLGEEIAVTVDFSHPVNVTGTPVLTLGIGIWFRFASYRSGSGSTALRFEYALRNDDADADGITIAADALRGAVGNITDHELGTIGLDLGSHAITDAPGHAVAGREPARVIGVRIASAPRTGGAYGSGEKIVVTISFSHPVRVTGSPVLALAVGAQVRSAAYEGGGDTDMLRFGYTVRDGDSDDDGIGIAANALQAGGGITDLQLGPASLDLGIHAIADARGHAVAGRAPASVSGVRITSTASAAGVYGVGDRIVVAVDFTYPVNVTGIPILRLAVGARDRSAVYQGGDGTGTLRFAYTVQDGDHDDDGIGIAANALQAGGGITDLQLGPADLDLGSHAISDAANHRVLGRTPARVSGVRITSTANAAGVYGLGDEIVVAVDFTYPVNVTGMPILRLAVGARDRSAVYQGGDGTGTLRFAYTVQDGDRDDDGIGIAANALQAGGGITDLQSEPADLDLGSHAINDAANHRVLGRTPASVAAVFVSLEPRHGDTYGERETIVISVSFSHPVTVTGNPTLALMVGARLRQAALQSGGSENILLFAYTVQSGDTDDDGITIAADALQPGDGSIVDTPLGEAANLDLGDVLADFNASPRKMLGRRLAYITDVRITSTPIAASTYAPGERITVEIEFSHPVSASGLAAQPARPPGLLLEIGNQPKLADYVGGSGTNTFSFAYTVRSGDSDDDNGISIPNHALQLGGHTIDDPVLGPISPLLGAHTITQGDRAFSTLQPHDVTNAPEHKVTGTAPTRVSGVRITSAPMQGSSYGLGEKIEVAITFSRRVTVIASSAPSTPSLSSPSSLPGPSSPGSPALTLVIGTQTRPAPYQGGSGTNTLTFAYTVQSTDDDDDGISITVLERGGSDMTDVLLNPAHLGLGAHAITNDPGHRVDGSLVPAASVAAVQITSVPLAQATYGATEVITVQVAFTGNISLGSISSEFPVLNLTIGSQTRPAAFQSRLDAPTRLVFQYAVQTGDVDDNGIGIAADALNFGGSTPTDATTGDAVSPNLGEHAIANASGHAVDGNVDRVATITEVALLSTPHTGDTYGPGETITVRVAFSETVTVTDAATNGPHLVLTIGTASRSVRVRATGAQRRLRFDYAVQGTDLDADGLSIAADALRLGGGNINDAGGQAANLDLGTLAVTDNASHKVDGSIDTPPTADAGADIRADTATIVSLDGSGSSDLQTSDADLSYAWSQVCGPQVILSDPTAAETTFTATTIRAGGIESFLGRIPDIPEGVDPFAVYTTLTFRLTVTDEQGNQDTDTVTVTVAPNFTPEPFPAASTLQNRCVHARGSDETPGTALDERKWLRSWIQETYLWYDEVVDHDPADYEDMDTYFDLMKTFAEAASCGKPKDEFHFTTRTFAASGTSAQSEVGDSGVGVQFARALSSRRELLIFVDFVHPTSPAASVPLTNDAGDVVATGFRRGDRVVEVGGFEVSFFYFYEVLSLLLDERVGVTHAYKIERDGVMLNASITTGIFEIDPVPQRKVIDTGSGKVGYLHFLDHTGAAEAELIEAIEFFKGENITDLVLDMRYNSGGFLAIANGLATMIANPSTTSGQIYERLVYGDNSSRLNRVDFFEPTRVFSSPVRGPLPNLNLDRLFVLTTDITCSASESLINGLRGVDFEVIQVGTTTCGKPYGTLSTPNCGIIYSITQFIGVNAKGFGDYQHGFTPTTGIPPLEEVHESSVRLPGCWANDSDYDHQLGDENERLLRMALNYRASIGSPGGPSCTTPAASGTAPRGLTEKRLEHESTSHKLSTGGRRIVELE